MPVHFELPHDHPQVALVTLDRPEKANSLDPQMLVELAAAWRRVGRIPLVTRLVGSLERVGVDRIRVACAAARAPADLRARKPETRVEGLEAPADGPLPARFVACSVWAAITGGVHLARLFLASRGVGVPEPAR